MVQTWLTSLHANILKDSKIFNIYIVHTGVVVASRSLTVLTVRLDSGTNVGEYSVTALENRLQKQLSVFLCVLQKPMGGTFHPGKKKKKPTKIISIAVNVPENMFLIKR